MKFNSTYVSCFLLLFCFFLNAQELPPIETYAPKQYEGENQNWAISQSQQKYIYVANNKGLLEFNGSKWRLYNSPNETVIRSVTVVNDYIYTGCYMEFGFWKHNASGELVYNSLSQTLKTPLVEDEQFWKIIALDDWILFQSLNRIYIYNTKDLSFKIIESDTSITKMYSVDDTIYFQKFNEGLFKIENGKANLVAEDDILKTKVIINVFNFNSGLLIQTQENGFYVLNNTILKKWDISSNPLLSKVSVYNSIKLKDGSFALGTISNGVIHLTQKGDIIYQINHSSGLNNNTVLSLFEDVDHNIWLGLDNGINCINIASPYVIFNDQKGDLGTVYNSVVYNNKLYLGTNQGLFYKPINTKAELKFIEGTKGQVWTLKTFYGTLFCGHNSGTFVIDNDKAILISNVQGTWNIQKVAEHENLLLQGNFNGLNVLEYTNGNWRFKNKIEGFNISSRYFERSKTDEILVSHEYKGIFKLKIDKNFTKVLLVAKDSTIEKGLNSSLLKYNDDILYTYKAGVFKYNSTTSLFKKDTLLTKVFDKQDYISGKLVSDQDTDKLWGFSNNGLNYIVPGKLSHIPKIITISLPQSIRKSMVGYENISHVKDEKYLLGTSTGYVIIDLNKLNSQNFNYNISINSVEVSALNKKNRLIDFNHEDNFINSENNLNFTFSVPEFDKYAKVEYKYILEGFYEKWSNWSSNSNELFKNLPYGNYTFKVKGRVGFDETNNIASYKFKIEKPFYLNNVMVAIYLLSVVLFSIVMHNVYKRYYKRQRERLLKKTERELELKKLENEQQRMAFQNEKLQQDIESKNRELAISTMSLIKKNEFLNDIKNELKNTEESKNLKPVIKIIDKNLNNTDDWKMFQEAFNNADKNFLKKIKTKHPKLTPNDLRLCAYLRLNLSSKEIAPLLNISPRSVEVKRYRLRKKMDLPHESSLTNYILDL